VISSHTSHNVVFSFHTPTFCINFLEVSQILSNRATCFLAVFTNILSSGFTHINSQPAPAIAHNHFTARLHILVTAFGTCEIAHSTNSFIPHTPQLLDCVG